MYWSLILSSSVSMLHAWWFFCCPSLTFVVFLLLQCNTVHIERNNSVRDHWGHWLAEVKSKVVRFYRTSTKTFWHSFQKDQGFLIMGLIVHSLIWHFLQCNCCELNGIYGKTTLKSIRWVVFAPGFWHPCLFLITQNNDSIYILTNLIAAQECFIPHRIHRNVRHFDRISFNKNVSKF